VSGDPAERVPRSAERAAAGEAGTTAGVGEVAAVVAPKAPRPRPGLQVQAVAAAVVAVTM